METISALLNPAHNISVSTAQEEEKVYRETLAKQGCTLTLPVNKTVGGSYSEIGHFFFIVNFFF